MNDFRNLYIKHIKRAFVNNYYTTFTNSRCFVFPSCYARFIITKSGSHINKKMNEITWNVSEYRFKSNVIKPTIILVNYSNHQLNYHLIILCRLKKLTLVQPPWPWIKKKHGAHVSIPTERP